jgi:AcrR family transcriptional regulator
VSFGAQKYSIWNICVNWYISYGPMTRLAKHRHPPQSGYARGEETRARIVLTALRLFGEQGFDGASTRDIAAAAGVNAPALQYYFDSKEGLYVACVEHIVERVWEHLGAVVAQAERVLRSSRDDEELIEAFCAIQARTAEFMFTSHEAHDWRLFMARQQSGGGPAAGFELFYEKVNRRMRSVTVEIVGRLLGVPATSDEALIRTMTLNGQLTMFQVIRRSALTALNWESVDGPRLALLQKIIREHTTVLLRSMIATREAGRRKTQRNGARRAARIS